MTEELRQLHVDGATGKARVEMFHGREHLVVPVVALIGDQTIHAVNAVSPEHVPAALLSQMPSTWNGRPIVLQHPTDGQGHQISANDPQVMERQAFGFMADTHLNNKRLGTEAWADVERLKQLGQHQMLQDFKDGKPVSISVGAFVTTNGKSGMAGGRAYKNEWASLVPDHLAFLPGGVGACSLEAGCGSGRHATAHLVTASGYRLLDGRTDNDRKTLVQNAAQKKWSSKDSKVYTYVRDLDGDNAIVERADGLFSVPFEIDDQGVVTFDGDGTPVETKYATLQRTQSKSLLSRARTLGVTSVLEVLGGPGSGPRPGEDTRGAVPIKGPHGIMIHDYGKGVSVVHAPGQNHIVKLGGRAVGSYSDRVAAHEAAQGHLKNEDSLKKAHEYGYRGASFGDFELGSPVQILSTGITGTISSVSGDEITVESESGDELGPFGEDELKTLGGPGSRPHGSGQHNANAASMKAWTATKRATRTNSPMHHDVAARAHEKAAQMQRVQSQVTAADNHQKQADFHDNAPARRLSAAGALSDKSQVGGKMADCATCGGTGKTGSTKCPDCTHSRSLRQRLEALFKPIITTLAEGDPPADPEDTAELVSYEAMQELIGQAQASLTSGAAQVQALIDASQDDEDLEDARLEALISMCMQLYGTINGIVKIATAQLSDDDSIPPMQSYMAHLVGKEISAKNMAAIQGAHDNAHDLHKNLTDLGAECNGMKLLSAVADGATDSKGDTMDKTQRTATIKALTESKCGCYTADDAKWLEAMPDDRLEGLKTLSENGIKALAFSKADAEKVITDKKTADDALAAHAAGLKDKADKAKAKEDAVEGDETEVKAAAARLVAAKAAGFETVEAHEQGQFYAKNPEIKALVDRQKAQDMARKNELITVLEGAQKVHSKDALKTFGLDRLEEIAALVNVAKPDFSGRGLAVATDTSDVFMNPPDPYLKALEARRARVQ